MEGYIHRSSRLPLPAIVGVNWSQSTSWVSSVFACHLVRCGGAEEKRSKSSTAHITGRSLGLSAYVSWIPKEKKKKKNTHRKEKQQRMGREKDLPYAFIGDRMLFVVTQTSDGIDFQGTGYGEPYFPLYLFKCLFEERVLKCFLCCTIFSTPGGHPALLLNICKLQTMFPMLPFFTLPVWSMSSLFNMTSFFEFVFHSSLQDLPPIPLYFWLLSPKVTPLPWRSFTPCRREVAPLRYPRLVFLSEFFYLPR